MLNECEVPVKVIVVFTLTQTFPSCMGKTAPSVKLNRIDNLFRIKQTEESRWRQRVKECRNGTTWFISHAGDLVAPAVIRHSPNAKIISIYIFFPTAYIPLQLAFIGHIVVAFCIKYAFSVVKDGLLRKVSSSFFHT